MPETVRQEVDHLKALYDGFHYREPARILFVQLGYTVDDKTIKTLWQDSPVSCQGHLGLWDYHAQPDYYQARVRVIQLYYQGWEKTIISRFLKVSRPTVDAWIRRFETEQFAGLLDRAERPRPLPVKFGCRSWCRSITSRRPIPMPGSFGSGASWRSLRSPCGRSGG